MKSGGPEPPCRSCGEPLCHSFVDLGKSPLCESFLSRTDLDRMERFYPLHTWVCHECFLVQLQAYVDVGEIFTEYAYFSSFSESWLAHAREYVNLAVESFGLDSKSFVVELASNDGYLLRNFVERGIPCLGIEPARNVAAAAEKVGVRTVTEFFGVDLAKRLLEETERPDLIVGNNVLAQVPDLNDFVEGIRTYLSPEGVATLEFPHLVRLVEGNQFDTIYHEHFSYFSLISAMEVFTRHGLEVFDVQELATHGGSLRIFVHHLENKARAVTRRTQEVLASERELGLDQLAYYERFSDRVEKVKRDLLRFLIDAREAGQSVAGYGAPGKGNTLLNYCGIRTDLLSWTVDRNPYKQGMFLPGTHIPVFSPEYIDQMKPDFILILPWNLRQEITAQLAYVREWGARFVVPIPELEVID